MVILQDAYIQVSKDCNQDCVFCTQPKEKISYTYEETINLIDSFRAKGATSVVYTGGEPTLVPFLDKLITYVDSFGMNQRVITNGALLDDIEYCKKLKSAGLGHVIISLHSHIPEVSKKIRTVNHLEKSLKAIRNLLNLNMTVHINCTINSLNAPHLYDYSKFMLKHFPEIGHYGFNFIEVGGNAAINTWTVPKISKIELQLHKALHNLISHGKSLRVERVPLCYMCNLEEYSSEARRFLGNQKYQTQFTDGHLQEFSTEGYRHAEDCKVCTLKGICPGLKQAYIAVHGLDELYPLFKDPQKLIDMNLSD